jgi:hypothetical protein
MNEKSILMPPKGAEKLASKLDPPEYGTELISVNHKIHSSGHTHGDLVLVAHLGDLGNFVG